MAQSAQQEEVLGKAYDLRLIRHLWKFIIPYKRLFFFTMLLLPLQQAFGVAQPYLRKIGIDQYIAGKDLWGLQYVMLLFLGALIGETVAAFAHHYFSMLVAQRCWADLRATGLFQLALGLARMGVLVNFISHTVVIGFTAGAAVLIAGSQIESFFGLEMARGIPFYEVLHQLFVQFDNINVWVTFIGALTLVTGILSKRFLPKLPYMIVAMVVASVVATLLNNMYGAEVTHIKTVGPLPAALPPLSLPDFSHQAIASTLFPALVITMLAVTEAVSISR